ncbi:MAG: transposase [Calditrichaeota bacterium]|nr:transposase [Calditrichota bacterium]
MKPRNKTKVGIRAGSGGPRHQARHRKKYSADDKIRIILEGLRGETAIAEICRREGLATGLYYRWSKDFLEAGKKRLQGDIVREANSNDVNELRKENAQLRDLVANFAVKNEVLKKSLRGLDDDLDEL